MSYIGLVFVSGFISSALQSELLKFIPVPILVKVIADTIFFVFNFLFIRDLIFDRWTKPNTED